MSTVQTKPLFSTVSKIIAWANKPDLDSVNCDQVMRITPEYLERAISKLEINSKQFSLQNREQIDIDFGRYLLNFKDATFDTIKNNYASIFNIVYEQEKAWMCPIEQKLHYIKTESDRKAVQYIIDKLKDKTYSFNKSDETELSTFSRVIDKTINATNFLNNFTIPNLAKINLTIYDLFNKIKSSNSLEELSSDITLSGTLNKFLPFYYSAVKHSQSPLLYPIYYKYWYTCLNNIFNKSSDYDALTKYYRDFPKEDRHINFCAFWGALGKAILLEMKKDFSINNKQSKIYKRLFKLIPFERYIDEIFINNKITEPVDVRVLNINQFYADLSTAGLLFSQKTITRFISSLITKPFVILSGLSGSGKTKLAQAFAQWICEDDNQYCIVPVGADWTNREPLLGFPNALKPDEYIKPDNGALDVIIQANENLDLPYFLILDEMNLSHVERYFADFLSVMESHEEIPLFAEGTVNNGVPSKLLLPPNLFIIGTVNIDETTYMFSPKVLDRANTIEFRVTKSEIENFLENQKEVEMSELTTKGASMAGSFLHLSQNRDFEEHDMKQINTTLISFFEQLKRTGAEFGYRSANEIIRLINQLTVIDDSLNDDEKLDIAIMQKLLPKLHGSRRKLTPILITLGDFCIDNEKIKDIEKEVFGVDDFDFDSNGNVKHPLSLEKISRMYKGAVDNGFASYAEA